LDVGRAFCTRDRKRLQQDRVLRDVVSGGAKIAGDFDDVAGVGRHVDAVAGRTRIAARRAIDIGGHLQDGGLSRWRMRWQPSQRTSSPRLSCWKSAGRIRVRHALQESLTTRATATFWRCLKI